MRLEIEAVEFWNIGERSTRSSEQWGTIALWMKDKAEGRNHTVEVKVVVPRRADVTWSEIQEAGRTQAVTILRRATEALENGSLEDLRKHLDKQWEERTAPIDADYFLKPHEAPGPDSDEIDT
jgi:hypothetical protein